MNKGVSYNYNVLLLAAGSSSRLGKPKQLLQFNGQSLLEHMVNIAVGSDAEFVVVVLGANADLLQKKVDEAKAQVVINTKWNEGMASSIICGINALTQINPSAEAVMIMVCDQPFITTSLLNKLITTHKSTGNKIVASCYNNTTGPPVLFHKDLFPELMQLKGDFGARSIIQKFADEVAVVEFKKGDIDIDTTNDYEMLLKTMNDN